MAKRKEHIQTDAPQQAQTGAGAIPQEALSPPPLPDLTVRVFPISSSKSKLKATANVNIAGAFAIQGFRIFDFKNGLPAMRTLRTRARPSHSLSQKSGLPLPPMASIPPSRS